MRQSGWDDASFEIAKKMLHDGCSHGVISSALRAKGYDLSRNAVIGKLSRHGFIGHASSSKQNLPRQIVARQIVERVYIKKSHPAAPTTELMISYIGPVARFPPKGCCQYTRDDTGRLDWQMCGHPVQKIESRWCPDHAAICYQPVHKMAAG